MDQNLAMHYVCTREEAWDLVRLAGGRVAPIAERGAADEELP